MTTAQLLGIVPLLGMLLWAAIEDLHTRRIRNWLTLSMILSGFLQSLLHGGVVGPWNSAFGFVVGALLGLFLAILGAVGGGDFKLLIGIGTWLGAAGVFEVYCGQAVIGMVIILTQSAAQGRLRVLTRNSAMLAINLVHLNQVGLEHMTLTGQSCRSVDRPLPFAVPVLLAVLGLILAGCRW